MYVADFETRTVFPTYVWGYGIVEIGKLDNIKYGTSITQFFNDVEDKQVYFFHNLKFDGMFILDYILKLGLTYTHNRQVLYNQFNCIISDNKMFYNIRVNFYGKVVEFRDSYKKLPFRVERIAEAFFKDELKKLEIDYNTHREEGGILSDKDKEYIKADIVIIARALELQLKQGMNALTTGADALKRYKKVMGKSFDRLFPQLSNEIDTHIRKSYKGGYVHIKAEHKGRDINKHGNTYDVNSLYPFVMVHRPYPCGEPVYYDGKYIQDSAYPLYIQNFSCAFVVKEGHLPTVQIKKNSLYNDTEYCVDSKGVVNLTMTSIDLQLFLEHYDIIPINDECDIAYHWGYKFKSVRGIFDEYILPIYEKKCHTIGAEKELNKLMLNALYGKFAKRKEANLVIPYLDEETQSFVRLNRIQENYGKTVYLPVGTFITAYAREYTIRTGQKMYDQYVYADTDSLHIIGDAPEWLEVDKFKLGAWKHEEEWEQARFIRPKRYIEIGSSTSTIKCCGLTNKSHSQITWDNFITGTCFVGNLKQKIGPGGVVLCDSGFILN